MSIDGELFLLPDNWLVARVAISSASFCESKPYDFAHILSFQVSMSICVGPLYPDKLTVLDAI